MNATRSGVADAKHTRTRASLSRRTLLKLAAATVGAGAASLLTPVVALADREAELRAQADATQAQIDDAQARYDAAQAELDQIAAEFEELAARQAQTLADIEATQGQIEETQAAIEQKTAEIADSQERLGARVAAAYKSGPTSWLDLLFSATSFEELTSSIVYLDRISASERALIDGIRDAKAELQAQQAALEEQKAQLEALSAQQQAQMEEMQANQARVQELLDSLDEEIIALIAQHDEEILAAEQEAARARQEREAAAAAASSSGGSSGVYGTLSSSGASGSAARVVSACHSTPSPGYGLCAGWVTNVFVNAGIGYIGGNANDQYNAWCTSSNRANLMPGMIIAVSSHPHTSAGRIYGHVGIYVGNGTVMDNIGYIRSIGVESWISFYGATVTPRWGWFGGIALS